MSNLYNQHGLVRICQTFTPLSESAQRILSQTRLQVLTSERALLGRADNGFWIGVSAAIGMTQPR